MCVTSGVLWVDARRVMGGREDRFAPCSVVFDLFVLI